MSIFDFGAHDLDGTLKEFMHIRCSKLKLYFAAGEERKAETTAEARLCGCIFSREVRIMDHISNPSGLFRGEHSSRQTDPVQERNGARDRFELGEPGHARTPRCFTTQHLLFLTVQPDGTENPIPARGNRLDDLRPGCGE